MLEIITDHATATADDDGSLLSYGTVGFLVLFAVAPFLTSQSLLLGSILVFGVFAMGYNLLLGYTGMLSFGHAAFFGLGTYLAAFGIMEWNLSLVSMFALVVVASALLGLIFGYISLRRRGLYFAMITLALGQAVYAFIYYSQFTGGSNGLRFPDRLLHVLPAMVPMDFTDTTVAYYFVLVVGFLIVVAIKRIVNSPFGLTIMSIRENEERSDYVGYDTERVLLYAFVMSAIITAIAGVLNALLYGFASPNNAHWLTTGDVLVITLIGGIQSFFGPLVGAAVFIGMEDILLEIGDVDTLLMGVILIAVILLFPSGIVGSVRKWYFNR
jgi:branched-chain amino acid transport system permease protein